MGSVLANISNGWLWSLFPMALLWEFYFTWNSYFKVIIWKRIWHMSMATRVILHSPINLYGGHFQMHFRVEEKFPSTETLSIHVIMQRSTDLFCTGTECKWFWLCRPYGHCHSYYSFVAQKFKGRAAWQYKFIYKSRQQLEAWLKW
jgi:hypothetical protein